METKIKECQTLKELLVLGSQSVLNEMEQCLVFERQMEIFQRIMEWRLESEHLGLAPDLTDTWTPEQCEACLHQWNDKKQGSVCQMVRVPCKIQFLDSCIRSKRYLKTCLKYIIYHFHHV